MLCRNCDAVTLMTAEILAGQSSGPVAAGEAKLPRELRRGSGADGRGWSVTAMHLASTIGAAAGTGGANLLQLLLKPEVL